ncbi:MAG: adenosylcobinamide amidohydrolase [Nitrospirae bacterium]|nr:adenosylcobinamide amidohydrolase [Nitrospirota bacterium]
MGRRSSASFLTRFRIACDTLVIDLETRRRVLSSAPCGGGLVHARYIVTHQVAANPVATPVSTPRHTWGDPARYLSRVAANLGADRDCVALMTAVALKQLVTLREEMAGIWVEGFFTVGVSNAVQAGEPPVPSADGKNRFVPGTINIILVTNARLATPAMVGAVQVATESKTAVLLSKRVPSWTGLPGATGTGTDAVVVACGEGPAFQYSGTHTEIGAMIGRLVNRGVAEGLIRSNHRTRRTSKTPR